MNISKHIVILSLGLAIGAQAQDAAAQAPAAPEAPAVESAAPATDENATEATKAEDSAQTDATDASAGDTTNGAENVTGNDAVNGAGDNAGNGVGNGATPAEAADAAASDANSETAQAGGSIADSTQATEASSTPADSAVASANGNIDPNASLAAADTTAQTAGADSAATPAAQDSAAVAAADSSAPAAEPAAAHPMDILHGNAYNAVGNEAAAATVNGNLSMPHKMRGSKFAYFEPIDIQGVAAFGDDITAFLAFDNTQNLGLVSAGLAFGRFGFSAEAATGHSWDYADIGENSQEVKSTTAGNLYGGAFSMKLGSLDIGLSGRYVNPDEQLFIGQNGNEAEVSSWDAIGKLAVSKSDNPKFAWTAAISFVRHDAESRSVERATTFTEGKTYLITHKVKTTDSSAHVEITPEFNFGSNVLKTDRARIFIGLNTSVATVVFDKIDNVREKEYTVAAYTTPNILGEVALGNHMMAFGSAEHVFNAYTYKKFKLNDTEIKSIKEQNEATNVNLGARFQYEQAAIEMTFTKQFLQNPFGSFSDHDDIAMSIGAFIMF